VPHVQRPAVTRSNGVHVTLRLVEGLPSLRRPRSLLLIERVFAAERRKKGFRLVHYAVRGNHVHLVCEAEQRQALSRGIQRLSARIARGVNRLWRREGRLFADRFHSRVIRTPREARHLLAYVLLNAHKDYARGGTRLIGLDPCSSGRFFDGWADGFARPPRA
jgi:REP element-mobilizing transposase RayT